PHHRYPAFSRPQLSCRVALGAFKNVWPSHWCAYPGGMLSALLVAPENVQPASWFGSKLRNWVPPVTVKTASKLPVPFVVSSTDWKFVSAPTMIGVPSVQLLG